MLSSVAVLFAVLGFCFVIVIHELGHFLFAKWAGVKVLAFSVGFGPVIYKKQIGETEYRISAVWAGGYVKMLGEIDETEGLEDPRSYAKAKPGWKALILLGGVLFNLVSSWILLVVLAFWGMPLLRPVVGEIQQRVTNSEDNAFITTPALALGLEVGDEIRAVNGERVWSIEDVGMKLIRVGNDPLTLVVRRNGEDLTLAGDGTIHSAAMGDGVRRTIGFEPAISRRIDATLTTLGTPGDLPIERGWSLDAINGKALTGTGQQAWLTLAQWFGQRIDAGFTDLHGQSQTVSFRYLGNDDPLDYELGAPITLRSDPFSGSAAANAGLKAGDTLVAVDDKAIRGVSSLMAWLQQGETPGVRRVRYVRDGEAHEVDITVDASSGGRVVLGIPIFTQNWGQLPATVLAQDDSLLGKAGLTSNDCLFPVTREAKPGDATSDQLVARWIEGGQTLRLAISDVEMANKFRGTSRATVTAVDGDKVELTKADGSIVKLRNCRIAGLLADDRVVTVMSDSLIVARGGSERSANIALKADGIAFDFIRGDKEPYQLEGGIGEAVAMANNKVVATVAGTFDLIPKFFRSRADGGVDATKALSGPIGIFRMLKYSFERWGFAAWLEIVCMIGLNLFLINLLPIPIVDGGQLVILGIETAIRRPLPDTAKALVQYLGLAIVLSLMVFVLSLDVLRLIGAL